MKIYKKIVIDIETLKIIESVSFDYYGPLALCGGDGGGGGDGGEGGNPGAFGGPGAGPGDAPSGAPGSADGGTGISGAAYAGGMVSNPTTNFAGIQSDFEGINADIEANPDVPGSQAQLNQQAKAKFTTKAKTALTKAFTTVIDVALATLSPLTAAVQAVSVMATRKGVVANMAELATAYMQSNPQAQPSEAVTAAFEQAGIQTGDIPPEALASIGEIANNTLGNNGQQIATTLNAVQDDSYQLSEEEIALLDEIETNQIQVFADTINERAYDITQKEIARLVDRGVLQGSVGENVLSNIQEEALKAIAQGTTEIQTERMRNELALIEGGREMQWRSSESARDRYLQQTIEEMQSEAADRASRWNLFGNVASGIIQGNMSDNDTWGWEDLF